MGIAFEMALASLGSTPGCDDPIRTALAQRIIVLAQGGERDPSVSVRVPCRQSVLLAAVRRPTKPPKPDGRSTNTSGFAVGQKTSGLVPRGWRT